MGRQKYAWRARVRQHGPEEWRKALSACVNGKRDILAFFRFLPPRISGLSKAPRIAPKR